MSGAYLLKLIEQSGLFDAEWYKSVYPDVELTGIDPLYHFVQYGERMGRSPGPKFDTLYYLETNPDVAESKGSPLVHYITHGRLEGRNPVPFVLDVRSLVPKFKEATSPANSSVDVVVPVFNALDDVKRCLTSLRDCGHDAGMQVIVVNDGSDAETSRWLSEFSVSSGFTLLNNESNIGYTRTVNRGLKYSSAPYVVTLNSDTIVTRGWARRLIDCLNSDPCLGIVGPLSNAASWQNVPILRNPDGSYAINEIPNNLSLDEFANLVSVTSKRRYPRLPFVNGFCFMIKREVIDTVGYMDELAFPLGYGEENDYCLRTGDAGYQLAIADDAYVFHAKSKSFGHANRKALAKAGSDTIQKKHGREKYLHRLALASDTRELDLVRTDIIEALEAAHAAEETLVTLSFSVVFLLPASGGGGGAHSVVQEASEMNRLGVKARIAVKQAKLDEYRVMYKDIPYAEELFISLGPNLLDVVEPFDAVVATIFTSVELLDKVLRAFPEKLGCYYVQDYEPLFFAPGTSHYAEAQQSYTLVDEAVLFAKTDWIRDTVFANHGKKVHKVAPSIDHATYFPRPRTTRGTVLSAMIRPQTPRRGAERTMRLLSRLKARYGDELKILIFGCNSASPHFSKLTCDFEFTNLGILGREEVSATLASSDIFIDLSDYQAFGRTALEAMACGATAVVPQAGGTGEYAVNAKNSLVVDSFDEEQCFEAVSSTIDSPGVLRQLKIHSLLTAARFSVHSAAISELVLISEQLYRKRKAQPQLTKIALQTLPDFDHNILPGLSRSWHTRILWPFNHPDAKRYFKFSIGDADTELPTNRVLVASWRQILRSDSAWETYVKFVRKGGKAIVDLDHGFFQYRQELVIALDEKGELAKLQFERMDILLDSASVYLSVTPEAPLQLGGNAGVSVRHVGCLDKSLWALGDERDFYNSQFSPKINVFRIGLVWEALGHDLQKPIISALSELKARFGESIEIEIIGASGAVPKLGTRIGPPKKRDFANLSTWLSQRIFWNATILAGQPRSDSDNRLPMCWEDAVALGSIPVYLGKDLARLGFEDGVDVVAASTDTIYDVLKRVISDRQRFELMARVARKNLVEKHFPASTHREMLAKVAAEIARRVHSEPTEIEVKVEYK